MKRLAEATDRELAAGVRDGDETSFRVLYRRHTPRLLAFLVRVLGGAEHRADAEDAVQEAWIRAVQALPAFRWESAFSSWLTGIGLNCARETLRRRAREVAGATDRQVEMLARRAPEPTHRLDLERAIGLLPDGYRMVLLLHDLEGFTHQEISERLDIAVGTSKSQLHHARRAIREILEPAREETKDAIG